METPDRWELKDEKLYREFSFRDFETAIWFINQVAKIAERLNHHPEIWNSYGTVRLTLSTHDEGDKATEKDYEFARDVNQL